MKADVDMVKLPVLWLKRVGAAKISERGGRRTSLWRESKADSGCLYRSIATGLAALVDGKGVRSSV